MNASFTDDWLEKSRSRTERSDPDFKDNVDIPLDDRVFLVYEQNLEKPGFRPLIEKRYLGCRSCMNSLV